MQAARKARRHGDARVQIAPRRLAGRAPQKGEAVRDDEGRGEVLPLQFRRQRGRAGKGISGGKRHRRKHRAGVRHRLFDRLSRACDQAQKPRLSRDRDGGGGARRPKGRRRLRRDGGQADRPHHRRHEEDHRVRRQGAGQGQAAQIQKYARHDLVRQVKRAVRTGHRQEAQDDSARQRPHRRRGLYGRHLAVAGGRQERRRVDGHRAHAKAGGDPQKILRQGLHLLRRRRRRSKGDGQGLGHPALAGARRARRVAARRTRSRRVRPQVRRGRLHRPARQGKAAL